MDLRFVEKIDQLNKDIVFGFIRESQLLFPSDNPYFNIVNLIKHICLLYYFRTFDSKILSESEQWEFLDLLSRQNKDLGVKFNLIYRLSRDGQFKKDEFREKCHDRKNLLCFIHTKDDDIYGGYTSSGWRKKNCPSGTYINDTKTFIFMIRSNQSQYNGNLPIIWNVKKDKSNLAIGHHDMYCCIFGYDWAIYVRFSDKGSSLHQNGECSYGPITLRPRVSETKVTEIEIFQADT